MEIQQVKSFLAVARLMSFKRAAQELHYAQSSISAQISSLEQSLGVRLFDRLGRKIHLTEAGDRLVQYSEKILDLVDETQAEVTGVKEPTGALTIRVPETICVYRLAPVIGKYRSRFPKVKLEFTTCTVEGLHKELRKGFIDLAFLITESLQAADLNMEAIGFESIVLVTNPTHPLTSKNAVKTKDLSGHTLLFSKVDCSYRKSFQKLLDDENVHIGQSIEFSSVEALKQCVIEGVGATVLPRIAVERELSQGSLIELPWTVGALEMAVLMVWCKDRWLSPSLKNFMTITKETINAY